MAWAQTTLVYYSFQGRLGLSQEPLLHGTQADVEEHKQDQGRCSLDSSISQLPLDEHNRSPCLAQKQDTIDELSSTIFPLQKALTNDTV